uniref:Uncharacterized protein n=1 Tax=Arundo donax TaxID=35708 RepID=A0A0A9G0P8_ARUDO
MSDLRIFNLMGAGSIFRTYTSIESIPQCTEPDPIVALNV